MMSSALQAVILVAKASTRSLSMSALGTSLALLLSLGGCTQSHGANVDLDNDGFDQSVDCDDTDPSIYPDATEICDDGRDQDCDGADLMCEVIINPLPDADGDGYTLDVDCNDNDPDIHPGQPDESCCARVDRNCDGIIGSSDPDPVPVSCNCFYDDDGDGWGEGFGPGPDCNDNDPTIHPGADEVCGDDIDQDCDGQDLECPPPIINPFPDVDLDGDGYAQDIDCDDNNPEVHPGAEEDVCSDGIDQDCDGVDGDPMVICNGFGAG